MAGSNTDQDNSSTPLLSTEEVDDANFLSSGRRGYEASNIEDRRQQLLEEKRKVEMRTLESSFRSLNTIHESEEIGTATAQELTRQREQLQNAEHKLDQMNSSLKSSQRHIRGIKSWFGGIKNYFSGSSKSETETTPSINQPSSSSSSPNTNSELDKDQAPRPRSKLASVLENRVENHGGIGSHPTERFRSEAMLESKDVDELLDRNLDMMGDSISRLKMLGLSLQDELGLQNELVDRITVKSEDVDSKVTQQQKDINRILKK